MIVITGRNAHEALPIAIHTLRTEGVKEDSRNGPVYRYPAPVATVLERPIERLTFHYWRDDNPFFLNVEALWMLAGRDDLKQLTPYVKRMAEFSDDGGKTSPGAYGKRWRDWHSVQQQCGFAQVPVVNAERGQWPDQLNWVVKRLRENNGDRRTVISMWDAGVDPARADANSKDVPCNLQVLPWIQNGALHLTVTNRSNDIIWGLYSANAVQFSTLLEYLARRIGVAPGTLTTISNNFHAYEATMPTGQLQAGANPYVHGSGQVIPLPDLWEEHEDEKAERIFQEDLAMVFEYGPEEAQLKARSGYLRRITLPLMIAHKHYRNAKGSDKFLGALDIVAQLPEVSDWRLAAETWLMRRYQNWVDKNP